MKATSILENGQTVSFECETFSSVEDVYLRADEYKNLGYEMSASIEYDGKDNESCCLYSCERLNDVSGSVVYLFKDDDSIEDLRRQGRSQDLIEQGLINDFIHFTMLSRAGAEFSSMGELFSMMDDCEDEDLGLDIQWIK